MRYLLIMLAALFIIGCTSPVSQGTDQTPTGGQPGQGGLGIKADVAISGFAYSPATITVPKGATVIWTNNDAVAHTVASDTGTSLDSGDISSGGTYSMTFTTPGTYNYHCTIHPNMKGTVVVEDTSLPQGA